MAERFLIESTMAKLGLKPAASTLGFLNKLRDSLDENLEDLSHRDQIFFDKFDDVMRRLNEAYKMTSLVAK